MLAIIPAWGEVLLVVEPNTGLHAARRAHSSPRYPGEELSRAELAELVAAEVHRRTGREAPIDGHYVAKLERGVIRWPGRDYRVALRAVLSAGSDAELGFRAPRRVEPTTGTATALPPALAAVATTSDGDPRTDADAVDRLAAVIDQPRRVDHTVVEPLLLAETANGKYRKDLTLRIPTRSG